MRFSTIRAFFLALLMTIGGANHSFAAGENISGKWSAPIGLPLVASSGALLPNGKVLLWAADDQFSFGAGGQVYTTLFDPATNSSSPRLYQGGHNMFCTGTTSLADGRILANGGSQSNVTTIYDSATNLATRVHDMNIARGYNANTILPDGSVLTVGGSWGGGVGEKRGEVWTAAGGWRPLYNLLTDGIAPVGVNVGALRDSHYWLTPAGNGRVFYAGPHPSMQWIDTAGNGSMTPAGVRGDDAFSVLGTAVMYDKGRILKMGGLATGDEGAPASASVYKIDINSGVSAIKISPMAYPRVFANSVVLPDGQVFVVGGQTNNYGFTDTNAVMPTEIWNPSTGNFTLAAPISVPRNYHSIALLLPDGRVLSSGSGLCGGCSANHPDAQIYSPGYLFDSAGNLKPRPVITGAPTELAYGKTITVTTDRDVTAFSIVRFGSTTHTINNDQRRLPLTFVKTAANTYQVTLPSNPGWMLPGYWMLFATDASGTPSVSKIVHVGVNPVANLSADAVYAFASGANVSIQPSIMKLNAGATLSISGLPAGLSFNAQTGAITGAATSVGSFPVTLSATDGTQTVSVEFLFMIDPPAGTGAGLLADYFTTTNLSGAIVASRVETPWFGNGAVGVSAGLNPAAPFSARWTGTMVSQRSGSTRIQMLSDDGVRVWINGKLVVDNWTGHGALFDQGDVDLVAGVRYPIYIEYYNDGGGNALQLYWQRPGDTSFSAIPTTQLYPGPALSTNNLARGKFATQSSDYFMWTGAQVAVDGYTNGDYTSGSVSLTFFDAAAWWQVDLGATVNVDRIRLWNRTDCCSDRLQNFNVFISNQDMTGKTLAQISGDPAIAKRTVLAANIPSNITIPGGVTGRYVRVQLNGTNSLQLAEVEVFGGAINQPPVISGLPSSMTMTIGAAMSRQISATDPEGQAVTFSATSLPAGLAISPSGLISGAPGSIGSGVATITATDAGGVSSSAAFSWTVISGLPSVASLPVNLAPVGATVTYNPVINNGAGVTYQWNFGDGSPVTAISPTAPISHAFMTAGVRNVTLIMRALDGRQTTYGFNQTVYTPQPGGPRPQSNSGSAYETPFSGGPRLWVANPDNDSVGVINLSTNALAAEIPVGKRGSRSPFIPMAMSGSSIATAPRSASLTRQRCQ